MARPRCCCTGRSVSSRSSSRRPRALSHLGWAGRESRMNERAADFETLLRQAFQPIDPPAELEERVELRLTGLVELAAEELEGWELSTLSDPRNWPGIPRSAAIATVGG